MYKTLSAPLTVQIEIVSACTSKCVHCYNFWRRNDDFSENKLFPDQIRIIMKKLHESKIFDIVITGGEPLLNKRGLFVCLEEVGKYNIGASLNSNLVILTRDYARELKKLGIRQILTSLHGPTAEIHDSIVQKKGSFDKTLLGIKLTIEEGIGVTANMVVTNANLKHVKKTAQLVSLLGVKNFAATKAGIPGNCTDFSKFSISLEDFRNYLEDLYSVGQEFNLNVDVLESYPLCGIKEVVKYKQFTGRKCLAGVTTFTVSSNGDVRPCSHLDVSYGNIFTEDINNVWMKMEKWRNGDFLPQDCRVCKLLKVCGGGCRMEAKMRIGSLSALDPYSLPDDVSFCNEILKSHRRKDERIKKSVSIFVLNKVKWRKEPFGAIILASKRSRVFLDENGANVFAQFKEGVVYDVGDKTLNWQGLNLQDFLLELAEKKVITLKERRGLVWQTG